MYIHYRTSIDELNGHFKINETLNDVAKKSGKEFKFTTYSIPADRQLFLTIYFYFVISILYIVFCKFFKGLCFFAPGSL